MMGLWPYIKLHKRSLAIVFGAVLVLCAVYLYKLGSLTGGLSSREIMYAVQAVGWHGIYHDPTFLPLKIIRSIVFFLFPDHGQTLTRLGNTLFGLLTCGLFYYLIRSWYGVRIGVLSAGIFSLSAWTLHVSRVASFDVVYLCAMTALLCTHIWLKKGASNKYWALTTYGVWLLLVSVPGMLWFVIAAIILQRESLRQALQKIGWAGRLGGGLLAAIYILVLGFAIIKHSLAKTMIGLPIDFGSVMHTAKQFAAVFVHLFIRGPEYPEIWLAKVPILDIFSLAMCIAGIYVFIINPRSQRSRMLLTYFLLGIVLVGLDGLVGLSVLIPLLYVCIATGLAYLLREWLQTFPANPIARTIGVGLVIIAVTASCLYNVRQYYVAWPHNETTKVTFRYHR